MSVPLITLSTRVSAALPVRTLTFLCCVSHWLKENKILFFLTFELLLIAKHNLAWTHGVNRLEANGLDGAVKDCQTCMMSKDCF